MIRTGNFLQIDKYLYFLNNELMSYTNFSIAMLPYAE